RPLWNHLAVPASFEIPSHRRELDLPAQRLEVSGALGLPRGNPVLADESLPRTMRQQGQLADALVLLEVGEDLLHDLQLLLERDVRGELRSMAENALLRVGRLVDEFVDHLHQLIPL